MFPNNDTDGVIKKFQEKLIRIGGIRNKVTHDSLFAFDSDNTDVNRLYAEFEDIIKQFEQFTSVILGDWKYRESYLYGR